MVKKIGLFLIAAFTAGSTAIAAGVGSSSSDWRAKYVGTWQGGCTPESGLSSHYVRVSIVASLGAPNEVHLERSEWEFSDANCTRSRDGGRPDIELFALTLLGTQNVQGKLVDRVRLSERGDSDDPPVKGIIHIADGKWHERFADDRPRPKLDAEGFPAALDLNRFLSKGAR